MQHSTRSAARVLAGSAVVLAIHAGCGGPANQGTGGGTSTSSASSSGTTSSTTSTSGGGTTGTTSSGTATSTSGATTSGASGSAATTSGASSSGTPDFYALPAPKQCDNQTYVPNCTPGNASTACGGKCSAINACQESTSSKPGDDVNFVCPRFMLFSDEMDQAAIDDGLTGFNYAVVGHDKDMGGIDGSDMTSCCQCYQLVYDYPAENQAWVDPNTTGTPVSALPPPPPLIVQSINTGTNGPDDFDVFMGAGGFGGNNACEPPSSWQAQAASQGSFPADVSGLYMYTSFPSDGESGNGGVKGASIYSACKTTTQWVTTESLSSAACTADISAACNTVASSSTTMTSETIRSCLKSNDPQAYYHLNWFVHAKKVECPTHLTQVTGCKLAPQGLPAVNPKVTTSAQAAADSSFKATAANGKHFSTTTMQDCCKPTCAWQDYVTGVNGGLTAVGQYNSFYSCDQGGVPITE